MQPPLVAEPRAGTENAAAVATSGNDAVRAMLGEGVALFHSIAIDIARLALETTNDLFEMDPRVSPGEVDAFKTRRGEWVKAFGTALRESFERRLGGQRRKGRRTDVEESLGSLRLVDDADASRQSALGDAARRLTAAAKQELEALDFRVAILFDEPPHREIDNPFAPAYLLDAIGATSRSLYPEPRIWRPLMERVVGDFVPTLNQTYVRLNRFFAERGVLPELGATLRARSDLRPADDRQLLPLFGRLLNDVHPELQAWHTLDTSAAAMVGQGLAVGNPYVAAMTNAPRRSTVGAPAFPHFDALMASRTLSPVLETLDAWQRVDPLAEHLRSNAPEGIDAGVTPVNRVPWIRAAIASQVPEESGRTSIDVVAFLFDYVFRDRSIPPRLRMVFDELEVPIVKVALADPDFFADNTHPARRLIDELASAAVGADDDEDYGDALASLALSIVTAIRSEFVLDTDAFERGCLRLNKFVDRWQKQVFLALQPHIAASLEAESRDDERNQVRKLIRDRLAGTDVPVDVRTFVGTVWADYLTRLRMQDGAEGDAYVAAVKTLDDMLWSIIVKERTGQKARLSLMIPPLVRSLRAGGAALQVPDEKMKRFLDALYALHIAAIKPAAATSLEASNAANLSPRSTFGDKRIANVHDFVADMVLGTWIEFDTGERRVNARLAWTSPMRITYVFATRSGSELITFTPEELAWELSSGKATLVLEPVPLFDRAVSAALETLADEKSKRDRGAPRAAADPASPHGGDSMPAAAQ